jgi:antirestriction protein ArdC
VSTKTKRKTISPAKREAAKVARQAKVDQINAYMNDAETGGHADSEQFAQFSGHFAKYSIRNQMLIFMQRPDATGVAGYRAWQAEGRQVRKGEKGIMIFGPARKRVIKEEKNGKEEERTISMPPPVVTVFDIAQTDPIEQ